MENTVTITPASSLVQTAVATSGLQVAPATQNQIAAAVASGTSQDKSLESLVHKAVDDASKAAVDAAEAEQQVDKLSKSVAKTAGLAQAADAAVRAAQYAQDRTQVALGAELLKLIAENMNIDAVTMGIIKDAVSDGRVTEFELGRTLAGVIRWVNGLQQAFGTRIAGLESKGKAWDASINVGRAALAIGTFAKSHVTNLESRAIKMGVVPPAGGATLKTKWLSIGGVDLSLRWLKQQVSWTANTIITGKPAQSSEAAKKTVKGAIQDLLKPDAPALVTFGPFGCQGMDAAVNIIFSNGWENGIVLIEVVGDDMRLCRFSWDGSAVSGDSGAKRARLLERMSKVLPSLTQDDPAVATFYVSTVGTLGARPDFLGILDWATQEGVDQTFDGLINYALTMAQGAASRFISNTVR